ncbi:MAG: MerR family transcriptional regulator [Acidobacteria bacterium]|nr:MerR family transcriptional regulator [Acidobacteriota bacterium]
MAREPIVIPEKIYFKIGEVCELLDVQAHVLRYWETEFPQLAPQKNRSGQRSYRRKDVETALRIKGLLYEDLYTIAGARKKLQQEQRENGKHKNGEIAVTAPAGGSEAPGLFDSDITPGENTAEEFGHGLPAMSAQGRDALRSLSAQLLELREMLKTSQTAEASEHLRNH